jgi:RNase P subunit RPR2
MKTYAFGLSEAEVREANKTAARAMRTDPHVEASCFVCSSALSPEDLERSECNGCHASLLEYGSCGIRYNSKDS